MIKKALRRLAGALALVWLVAAAAGQALAAPAAPAAKAPEVKTATAPVVSVSTVYTAERLRDPFQRAAAAGAAAMAGKPFNPEDFNIHNLSLRGIMKDAGTDYALFADNSFGVSFILRKGRLYDDKGKPVPGVSGSMNLKQKTVHLMTREKDVQVFRLGEEGKD